MRAVIDDTMIFAAIGPTTSLTVDGIELLHEPARAGVSCFVRAEQVVETDAKKHVLWPVVFSDRQETE